MSHLPVEVHEEVVKFLSPQEIATLRLACQLFASIFAPHIHRSVVIGGQRKGAHCDGYRLMSLASGCGAGATAAAKHAQTLYLDGLDMKAVEVFRLCISRWGRCSCRKPKHEKMTIFAEAPVPTSGIDLVKSAILGLKGLKKVVWKTGKDPIFPMMTAIFSLPALEALEFDSWSAWAALNPGAPIKVSSATVPRQLPSFAKFKWRFPEEQDDGDRTVKGYSAYIAHILSRSPNLSSLSLDNARSADMSQQTFLFALLLQCPASRRPLRIRHLELLNLCPTLVDRRVVSHFASLVSLRIRCSTSKKDLWVHLRQEGIWLEDIDTDEPCQDFLDYLESYQGLQSLEITGDPYERAPERGMDAVVSRFFSQSLGQHAESLKKLSLSMNHDGVWSFEESKWEMVAQYKQLTSLAWSISFTSTPADLVVLAGLFSGRVQRSTMDTLLRRLHQLPLLERVSVGYPTFGLTSSHLSASMIRLQAVSDYGIVCLKMETATKKVNSGDGRFLEVMIIGGSDVERRGYHVRLSEGDSDGMCELMTAELIEGPVMNVGDIGFS